MSLTIQFGGFMGNNGVLMGGTLLILVRHLAVYTLKVGYYLILSFYNNVLCILLDAITICLQARMALFKPLFNCPMCLYLSKIPRDP